MVIFIVPLAATVCAYSALAFKTIALDNFSDGFSYELLFS
jgi:hypothetical protein